MWKTVVRMRRLRSEGHTVVGVEGVRYVAEQAFAESGIEYDSEYIAEIDGFKLASKDGKMVRTWNFAKYLFGKRIFFFKKNQTIFACDFFNVSSSVLLGGDKFDSVFDRGSFGAVDKEDRERYAKYVTKISFTGGEAVGS